jgi:hypothetical protein
MSKKLLTVTAAVLSLALSACGMFDGMRGGDGGNTGTSSTAAAECRGLTGTALQDCMDRQRLKRGSESNRY